MFFDAPQAGDQTETAGWSGPWRSRSKRMLMYIEGLMTDYLRFDRFELSVDERSLTVDGKPSGLGSRAFDLLVALVERRDRVVPKGELLDVVWPGLVVEENNLEVQVSTLRKLLGAGTIATVAKRGYRFTALPEGRSAASPVSLASAAPQTNLSASLTRFIGREKALADCASLLDRSRLLTLTGIGGCGKTRLAQELAQQNLDSFADGVWFVDLATVQEGARVAPVVAGVLGVRDGEGEPVRARLQGHVASRQMLLVIDNCEHLLDAVIDVVDALLGARVRIIATSREAFGVAGEQIYPVQSLDLPESFEFDVVRESESARVFVDRACLVVPEFVLDEANAPLVADICRRLDGIALAIELAAARVALLSVKEIHDRLDDRFQLLSGGGRVLPRHQTLQAMMLWSYSQLLPAERQLFRCLSVFVGGWTLSAAARVSGASDEYEALDLLTKLHRKSLLVVDRQGIGEPRYRMLETVRQYAQARLDESGESRAARDNHLSYYVEQAEQAAVLHQGIGQGEVNAWLSVEQANLLAAHAWATHAPDGGALALRLAASWWRYFIASEQTRLGYQVGLASLQHGRPGVEPKARAHLLVGLSTISLVTGRYDESVASAEEALTLAREIDDVETLLTALIMLTYAPDADHDSILVADRLAEIEHLAQTRGDSLMKARSLNHLGEGFRRLDNYAPATAHYENALVAARDAGNPSTIAMIACNFGRLLVTVGATDRARHLLREALVICLDNHVPGLLPSLFDFGAGLALLSREPMRAARLYGAANSRLREFGQRREPVDEAFIAPLIRRAREQMGNKAFDSEEASGRCMDLDDGLIELEDCVNQGARV